MYTVRLHFQKIKHIQSVSVEENKYPKSFEWNDQLVELQYLKSAPEPISWTTNKNSDRGEFRTCWFSTLNTYKSGLSRIYHIELRSWEEWSSLDLIIAARVCIGFCGFACAQSLRLLCDHVGSSSWCLLHAQDLGVEPSRVSPFKAGAYSGCCCSCCFIVP